MHLIFGCSSGIGLALANRLHEQGEPLHLCSRKPDVLRSLFGSETQITEFDGLAPPATLAKPLHEIFSSEQRIDSIYIVFGTGHLNPDLDPSLEIETTQLNALAFTAVASHAMRHLLKQSSGKLIGISSVAAVRGSAHAPAYNASKAFVASYLEGLRLQAAKAKLPIQVTEIRPGFVNTAMMKTDNPFWVVSPQNAAKAILSAVDKSKPIAYTPRRWLLIALLLKHLPTFLYKKL